MYWLIMGAGQCLKIIESIVVLYTAVVLATRPHPLRWKGKIAKSILALLLGLILLVNVINSFYFKFSFIEIIINIVALIVILGIFYKIYFLQLSTQLLVYWLYICIFQNFMILLSCIEGRMSFYTYITNKEISWHWLHLLSMLIVIAAVLWLNYVTRKRCFIELRHRRSYWILCSLSVSGWVAFDLFSPFENYIDRPQMLYVVSFGLLFIIMISMILIAVSIRSNRMIKRRELTAEYNFSMMQEQYSLVKELYESKRKQVHDYRQQYAMILGFLKNKESDKAIAYIEMLTDDLHTMNLKVYTGITAIDFILDYKLSQAKAQHIHVDTAFDILFCPVKDMEICVILGNLMDNAIEAVMGLEASLRCIRLTMKTENNIFVMRISNPYHGKRRRIEGIYETTKENKELHGIGLESVERIIKSYDGDMDICDDGNHFTVNVSIFKRTL